MTFRLYKTKKPALVAGFKSNTKISAQNWIRTSTPLRALRPEHSASTNFAIWATDIRVRERKDNHLFLFSKKNNGNGYTNN